ncbi:MAG: hypothetical protein IT210_01895 [Armatimonadetes bacterium]|nr:hypothetical protein [Armatimonadota bacterium]
MKSSIYRLIGLVLAVLVLGTALYAQNMPKSGMVMQETTMGSPGKGMTATQTMYWNGNKVRLESNSPMGDQVVISDGKNSYIYSPAQKTAMKLPQQMNPESFAKQMDRQLGSMKKGKKIGTGKVMGRTCDIYTGSISDPRSKSKMNYKTWMLQGSFPFPMKIEATGAQGTASTVVKKLDLNYKPAASLFTLPKGTKITQPKQGGGMMGGGMPPGGGR